MKISVITAVYNRADTVADALDSVASQSHAAIEHVVVDGASTDGSGEILERRREQIGVLVSEPDRGIYSVYERLGRFDTRHRIAADYDLILRVLGRGGVRPAYIPQVLVRMRVGGASNRSIANILSKCREDYAALRENGVGGLAALAWKNLSKVGQFF